MRFFEELHVLGARNHECADDFILLGFWDISDQNLVKTVLTRYKSNYADKVSEASGRY